MKNRVEQLKRNSGVSTDQSDPEAQNGETNRDKYTEYFYNEAFEVNAELQELSSLLMKMCSAPGFPLALRKRSTTFIGKYVQQKGGKPEPIEWIALTIKDNNVLLVSKYALDCKKYNTYTEDGIYWLED